MKTIMYHYVRPDISNLHVNRDDIYTQHYCELDVFLKQLQYFGDRYGFVTEEDLVDFVEEKKDNDKVLLTFDDGLRDHYRYVYPILKEKKIYAIFFVNTGHYYTEKLLNVHRLHVLLSNIEIDKLWEEVKKYISLKERVKLGIAKLSNKWYTNQDIGRIEKNVKIYLNYMCEEEIKNEILDNLLNKYFAEDLLYRKFYMSLGDIGKMFNDGFLIGSHSHMHKSLSSLNKIEQKKDIELSYNILSPFDAGFRVFSYPYGVESSYNHDTLMVLNELRTNCSFAFDNKETNPDLKYQLGRLDCNKFYELK